MAGLHHRMRRAVAGAGGGGTIYTAKSVALDCATCAGTTVMGIRCVEFFLGGVLVEVLPADMAGSDATTDLGAGYYAPYMFDTSLSKIGSSAGSNSWVSAVGSYANQRSWVQFVSPITFDSIEINNFHSNGDPFDYGVLDLEILSTEDSTAPTNTFADPLVAGISIYTGTLREHTAVNEADPQILILN